jgi:hypothetical protein
MFVNYYYKTFYYIKYDYRPILKYVNHSVIRLVLFSALTFHVFEVLQQEIARGHNSNEHQPPAPQPKCDQHWPSDQCNCCDRVYQVQCKIFLTGLRQELDYPTKGSVKDHRTCKQVPKEGT